MKEQLKMGIFILVTILGVPLIIIYRTGYNSEACIEKIKYNIESKNEWKDIIQEEVLVGILAKQIPSTYEVQAIKAQALISRTYMARRILGIERNGALKGYSVDEMKELWGSDYDEIYDIYKEAIVDTCNEVIVYKNNIIEPLYHKSSSGVTRDGSALYHREIPYLKSVESLVDKVSKQIMMPRKDLTNRLKDEYKELVIIADNIEDQIQIVEKDTGGYVVSLQIGNLIIDGEEFRKLINLPSACFEIYVADNRIIFDVRGQGSGIGLSQNGSNELAKKGMNYKEIIQYYYTGIEIQKREM